MERREDSWPRGAPTPTSSCHGCDGENGEYALTNARSTWLRGEGGRGDHGEATSGMAVAFLQWRASGAKAEQWRAAADPTLRAEEMQMKQRLGGQALGWLQDAAVTPGRPRHVACATEGWRRVADTRRQASEPVGHGD